MSVTVEVTGVIENVVKVVILGFVFDDVVESVDVEVGVRIVFNVDVGGVGGVVD